MRSATQSRLAVHSSGQLGGSVGEVAEHVEFMNDPTLLADLPGAEQCEDDRQQNTGEADESVHDVPVEGGAGPDGARSRQ
jgi:hypothetical protein